jgi:hypothetical protein
VKNDIKTKGDLLNMDVAVSIDDRIEKYLEKETVGSEYVGMEKWEVIFDSWYKNPKRPSGKHDEIKANVFKYIKANERDLACIVMEADAEYVLGIDKPDLLFVEYGEGKRSKKFKYNIIEVENGVERDTKAKMDNIVKKIMRYGLVVDSFSVAIGEECKDDFLEKWDDPIKVVLGGKVDEVYQEYPNKSCVKCLESLGLKRIDSARLPENIDGIFRWDKSRKRVEMRVIPSSLQEIINFSLYLSSEDSVTMHKPS